MPATMRSAEKGSNLKGRDGACEGDVLGEGEGLRVGEGEGEGVGVGNGDDEATEKLLV